VFSHALYQALQLAAELWYARRHSLRSHSPRDRIGSAAAERYPLDRDTVLEHSGLMERDYLDEVKAIVSELRGESLDPLMATTRLAHDLAIEGDDAEEFLPVFSSRLRVDLSEFAFARHFSGEAIIPQLLWRMRHGHPLPMGPITLGELPRAAAAGRWGYHRDPRSNER
jgi:hypothetical protein